MRYINIFLLLISISFVACESMEDTYSEYAGTEKIRYTGKCKNLQIEPGWERFKLTWENSKDATVDSIKIVWQSDDYKDSILIDGKQTSYITEAVFENKNYEFSIYAIDINRRASIKVSNYAKPFTYNHPLIDVLGTVESKYFFVDDNLILFLADSDRDIMDATISYSQSGEAKIYNLTAEDFKEKFLTIKNVDLDKDVTINSSMKIVECIDTIHFEPYSLDKETKSFSADFISNLEIFYDREIITPEFLNNLETLYIDRNISTFEDILYLPNLKKVILGSHRYFPSNTNKKYFSKVFDIDKSEFSLEVMHDLKGIEIDIYGKNYDLADSLDFENSFPAPELPEVDFFSDMDLWDVTSDSETHISSNLKNLLDNNSRTMWKPIEVSGLIRNHEIVIDMKEIKELHGFLFSQVPQSWYNNYVPETMELSISNDQVTWGKPFTYLVHDLGIAPGESTLLKLKDTKQARYVKIVVRDRVGYSNNYVLVGDFIPF